MTRIMLFVVLIQVVTAAVAQDFRAEPEQKIRILDAIYGQDQRICSVYAEVARDCDGRSYCEIRAGNALCGGSDPYRNVAKQLFVGWNCGDGRRSITVDQNQLARIYCLGAVLRQEPATVAIPDAPAASDAVRWVRGQIAIEVVRYGARDAYCDATAVFARACDDQQSCSMYVDNDMCGDPHSGVRKRAYITYHCNGKQVQYVVSERELASLECAE